MTEAGPERRRRAVEALAGSYAIQRMQPGDDWDTVLAECIAEAENDPEVDEIIACTDAAPPPEDWDPEVRRAVRRLLHQPAGS